ncbi:MAG: tetratricopeptide repeat protein [Gemmatimonadetes bacterium]|nr:tetratricopeptide repeat protein [Gemmatimonadota bacterium]
MSDAPPGTPGYQRFFAELKRREVFRVAAVYGAVGFVVLQVADLLAEGLALPDVVLRTATFLVLIGFPIAVVLAWAYERTPQGMKRTDPAATGEIDAIVAESPSKRWPAGLLALAGVAALVWGAWLVGKRAGESGAETAEPSMTAETSGSGRTAPGTDAVLQLAYADLSEDERPSIAVLPFADMSREGDQEYFADGMTEELLNALAKIRELRVAGRTSSFQYKGQDKDLRQIGSELGVRYLVEGSIRKQDDQLRITAQLIDAEDSFHLWSETYDRELDDIFAVQEEISTSIAEALEVSLGLSGDETLVIPTADLEAYDLYLAAQARLRQRNEGVAEAVRLFGAAVARDSAWAPAWAGLAQAQALVPYYVRAEFGLEGVTKEAWERSLADAEQAARRALELDPSNAEAEVALGNVIRDRWQWQAAEAHYVRALEIDPDNVEAHQQYAEYLAASGRLDEALRSARRGVELDPTSAVRVYVLGYILRSNGRYDESISAELRAIELDSTLVRAQFGLIQSYALIGEFDRAESRGTDVVIPLVAEMDGLSSEERSTWEAEYRSMFEALGNGDAAALEACCPRQANSYTFSLIGDMDRALDALALEARTSVNFGTFAQSRMWMAHWDDVRSDPRFQEAARIYNLEGVEPHRSPPGS